MFFCQAKRRNHVLRKNEKISAKRKKKQGNDEIMPCKNDKKKKKKKKKKKRRNNGSRKKRNKAAQKRKDEKATNEKKKHENKHMASFRTTLFRFARFLSGVLWCILHFAWCLMAAKRLNGTNQPP